MVAHKEFATAGKAPGLQIWRIENMDLKPVPKNQYGNFYTGDAYLLLYTTTAPSYYIHMWLGEFRYSAFSFGVSPDVLNKKIRLEVLSFSILAFEYTSPYLLKHFCLLGFRETHVRGDANVAKTFRRDETSC